MEVLTSGYGLVEVRAWHTEAGGFVGVETNVGGGRQCWQMWGVGPVDVGM